MSYSGFGIEQHYIQELKELKEQYRELKEALVGDSDNWTHEDLIEKILSLVDRSHRGG